MQVYRICLAPFAELDGEGARRFGGRWNTPGTALVYASNSRALAALEALVHLDPEDAPPDLMLLTIDVPDVAPDLIDLAGLQPGWMTTIGDPTLKAIGDEWASSGRGLLLSVPSAPIPEEMSILINPRHPDAPKVRTVSTRSFTFDPRLLA